MQFKFSKRSWILLIAMMIMNITVLTGVATGIIPDVIRLLLSLGAIFSIAQDWWRAREGAGGR